jgi:hypothetical protein
MQYRTLRAIGERMGWAPSTVLRRHKLDDFPIYLDWTARGLIWVTSDDLISRWELRKVMMSQMARLKRPWKQRHKPSYRSYNYRLRDKNRTGNGTVRPSIEGESRPSLRELTPESTEPCPCGVPSRCLVHNEWPLEKESVRPIYEEPPKLAPVNPAPPEGLAATVAQNVRPEGCMCGKGLTCTAHD